jgi:cytochrome c oxidase subunit IV
LGDRLTIQAGAAAMSNPAEQFKINLNQNLWGLIVGLGALGIAEYFQLRTLFWFSFAISLMMTASIAVTTLAYTINYWNHKQR